MFRKYFFDELLALQLDPIEAVRKDLACAAPHLKPYLDRDSKDAMQLTEMLIQLL